MPTRKRPSAASPIRPRPAPGTWSCTRDRTCRARTRRICSAGTCSRSRFMTSDPQSPTDPASPSDHAGEVVELSSASRATDIALDELEVVYAFIYARVGNRPDAEDLTQQVAMKAIPRLRQGAPASAIRGYLFATARSVLGAFWSTRLGLSEAELHEDLAMAIPAGPPSEEPAEIAAAAGLVAAGRGAQRMHPAFGKRLAAALESAPKGGWLAGRGARVAGLGIAAGAVAGGLAARALEPVPAPQAVGPRK